MDTHALKRKIEEQQRQLDADKALLNRTQNICLHTWTDPIYTPEHRDGYRHSGSYSSGYVSYDERPYTESFWVEPETIQKWTRTCTKCGKTETTTKSQEEKKVTYKPVFND